MTTAQAIEGMTDAGNFEILATRILRQTIPECSALQHLGVNAQGQTISAPVDGFCAVPNTSPTLYIMAAFTIGEGLKDKWLLDTSVTPRKGRTSANDGDLVKAIREAKSVQSNDALAKFRVYLCTNNQPQKELLHEAQAYGAMNSVDVHFLTRSTIRDHLDTDPRGQYLRKLHLGIDCELLSPELLHDICLQNVQAYEARLLSRVSRAVASQHLTLDAIDIHKSLNFLVGSSGQGKTSICLLALRQHVAGNRPALWLNEAVVDAAASLPEAVDRALRVYCPALSPDAGHVALTLIGETLLLVVDDLNRTRSPGNAARKLCDWSSSASSSSRSDKNDQVPSWRIIAPLWDSVAQQLPGAIEDKNLPASIGLVRVEPWTLNDADTYLLENLPSDDPRNSASSRQDAAKRCAGDPILLSSLVTVARTGATTPLDTLVDGVLGRYVEEELQRVHSNAHTASELRSALIDLAEFMLAERSFALPWLDVRAKLASCAGELRVLCSANACCRLTGDAAGETIEFRHDRLLEYFAVAALARMVIDYEANEAILADPFYAGFAAQAFLRQTAPLPLPWLLVKAPLVLAECIGLLVEDDSRTPDIVGAAHAWFSQQAPEGTALEYAHWLAARIFARIKSPLVLEVTNGARANIITQLARFANGDFDAGIAPLGGDHGFDPMMNDPWQEDLIRTATDLHREAMSEGCQRIFQADNPTPAELRASMAVAGFLQSPTLALSLSLAWQRSEAREELIEMAVWACLRCGGSDLKEAFDPIADYWVQLPEEVVEDRVHRSPRYAVADHVSHIMRLGLPYDAVTYLSQLGMQRSELRFAVALIFERLYMPDAIRYVVREAAASMERARQSGGHAMWAYDIPRLWNGRQHFPSLPLSLRDVVKELAFDSQIEPWLSRGARDLWIRITDDLDELRKIDEEDATFSTAVWHRVKFGDTTAVPAARTICGDRAFYWEIISPAWTHALEDECDEALAQLAIETPEDFSGGSKDEHYALAKCLRDIDHKTSIRLLLKHWHRLRNSRLFVQLALYLGTRELQQLVSKKVSELADPSQAFEHVNRFFGCLYDGLQDRISPRHLRTLEPYIEYLDNSVLHDLTRTSRLLGMKGWAERFIQPEAERRLGREEQLTELTQRIVLSDFKSDEDMAAALEPMVAYSQRKLAMELQIWWIYFERRSDGSERVTRILSLWLARVKSKAGFRVASELVAEKGRRSDVDLLAEWMDTHTDLQVSDLYERAKIAVCRRSLS